MNKVLQAKRTRKAKPESRTAINAKPAQSPPLGVTLPPLRVGVYEYGAMVNVVDIPDPRVNFCRFWDEMHSHEPHVAARPLPPVISDHDYERYAVVQMDPPEVVTRMLHHAEAKAYASQWCRRHGPVVVVREPVALPPDSEMVSMAIIEAEVNGVISNATTKKGGAA